MTTSPSRTTRPGQGVGWIPFASVACLLALWEGLARLGLPNVLFSSPSQVLAALARSVTSGEMLHHLAATLWRTVLGLLLGAVPGLLLGLAMGWFAPLRRALDPVMAAIHPIPKIAILPLLMVFLGPGEASRIAVAAVAAFFPMLINTIAGVRQIDPLYAEVARSYGASGMALFRSVVLPGSLPLVVSGLRLAANITLLVTIAAEIVMSERGLGAIIWRAWETLRVENLYATLAVVSALGIGIAALLRWLQRVVVPWQVDRSPGP